MELGFPELLLILVIVVLIFGPGRLAKLGGDLGVAIRSLRKGLDDADDEQEKPADKAGEISGPGAGH